jgi:hypothetical protein
MYDHLPLPLAFSQNAFCDQHVKYQKRDDAIRFSYEILAALFGDFADARFSTDHVCSQDYDESRFLFARST